MSRKKIQERRGNKYVTLTYEITGHWTWVGKLNIQYLREIKDEARARFSLETWDITTLKRRRGCGQLNN